MIKVPAVCFFLAACSAQVDGTHNGTPLAELGGNVQAEARSKAVPNAELTLIWENVDDQKPSFAESVPVEGEFPAAFTLAVYTPPPADAIKPDDKFAFGYIVSLEAGTDITKEDSLEDGFLGMDDDHMLIYVAEDIVAGSDAAIRLRSTPKAGFHLYDAGHLTEEEASRRSACAYELSDGGQGPSPTYAEIYEICGGEIWDDLFPSEKDLDTLLEVKLVDSIDQVDPAETH